MRNWHITFTFGSVRFTAIFNRHSAVGFDFRINISHSCKFSGWKN